MERRRSQRASVVANEAAKPSAKRNTSSRVKKSTVSGVKRKGVVREGGSQALKRAAFGDITNKKVASLRQGSSKLSSKSLGRKSGKSSTSTTVSDTSSVLSSSCSQGSRHILKSQDSNVSVQSTSTVDSIKSQISLPETSSAIQVTVPITERSSSTSTETSSILHIQAPVTDCERILNYTDIDKENSHDIFQSPEYAQDIFNYYKAKETEFLVDDYMVRQSEVTPAMRGVLVDWLVEVQENFELNHETLYLAVRLVDHYLAKHNVTKEALQLVGAAAVFIGCKFDERIPPMVDDFLYICDDAYNRTEFVRMEKDILRTVDFNLGMPISYRFLRRFAKAGKKNMTSLTLARYINETALMSYKIIPYKESLIAAGCLRLAMHMMEPKEHWNDTLQYYSGYTDNQLREVVMLLNTIMHTKNQSLRTVENKYSHPVFFEVANKPLIPSNQLLQEATPIAISVRGSLEVQV